MSLVPENLCHSKTCFKSCFDVDLIFLYGSLETIELVLNIQKTNAQYSTKYNKVYKMPIVHLSICKVLGPWGASDTILLVNHYHRLSWELLLNKHNGIGI